MEGYSCSKKMDFGPWPIGRTPVTIVDMAEEDLDGLAARVLAVFEDIHRRVFLGDPAANSRLKVEVLEPALAADTPTLVLITPWTLNGLAFPPHPHGTLPAELMIGRRRRPVFTNSLADIGQYNSVNLVPDVSSLESRAQARSLAEPLAVDFRSAVAAARADASVPDPSRRRLLHPWRVTS